MRTAFLIAAPLGMVWSTLGFYIHLVTLRWAVFSALEYIHAVLAGMMFGILLLVVLTPDVYRRYDRATPSV